MSARWVGVLGLLALAGCATTPHVWQRPDTGALASEAEYAECQQAALLETNRRWPVWYGGFGTYYWRGPYWRDPFWPSWGARSGVSWELSRLETLQNLTGFCMRVKGYRLLPLSPAAKEGPASDAPPQDATGSADDPPPLPSTRASVVSSAR